MRIINNLMTAGTLAIRVNHLRKQYKIGRAQQYHTFRDAIVDSLK